MRRQRQVVDGDGVQMTDASLSNRHGHSVRRQLGVFWLIWPTLKGCTRRGESESLSSEDEDEEGEAVIRKIPSWT